jgi:hypothetical protein
MDNFKEKSPLTKRAFLGLFNTNQSTLYWFLVSLAPFVMIISAYFIMRWSWGLMDDFQILETPGGLIQRAMTLFSGYCSFGFFRPTFAFYAGICYKIFAQHPQWFYVFKIILGYFVLFIWGWQAYRLTRNRLAFVLVPTITLSFHYFYDVFFYLSSQEILGLLFTGLALHFFIHAVNQVEDRCLKKSWLSWLLVVICLIAAFGSKEPFVSCGMAIGCTYFLPAIKSRSKALFLQGGSIIIFTVGYLLFLKLTIQSGYTANYDAMNFINIRRNLFAWTKKDLFNHLPWFFAWVFLIFQRFSTNVRHIVNYYQRSSLGISLGILLYLGYLTILLPWNTTSYYASPLGLFFAFVLTILISDLLSNCSEKVHAYIMVVGLIVNVVVCQYALLRETTYQYDTKNLMTWLHYNRDSFEQDSIKIYSNAMEPGMAIPGHMKRNWGSKIQCFTHSYDTHIMSGDTNTYYLFSPRFGALDQSLGRNYKVKFFSKNWVLYGHQ